MIYVVKRSAYVGVDAVHQEILGAMEIQESEDMQLETSPTDLKKNRSDQHIHEVLSRKSVYINFSPVVVLLSAMLPIVMIGISACISFFFHQHD